MTLESCRKIVPFCVPQDTSLPGLGVGVSGSEITTALRVHEDQKAKH